MAGFESYGSEKSRPLLSHGQGGNEDIDMDEMLNDLQNDSANIHHEKIDMGEDTQDTEAITSDAFSEKNYRRTILFITRFPFQQLFFPETEDQRIDL
jgi:hypothetical protein